MTSKNVHVVGAGLAGLSASVELITHGQSVIVYEGTNHAGGRCRSYHDSTLGMTIDNGNHLILTGNGSTLSYVDRIGAGDRLKSPHEKTFAFVDLTAGTRWVLNPSQGPIPWWIFDSNRRVPSTSARDYLSLIRLIYANGESTIGDTIKCSGPLYEGLIEPFLLAALNTHPSEGSAVLAASVVKETLARGARAYSPLFPRNGLSDALIAPAQTFICRHGGKVNYGRRLRNISFVDGNAAGLDFGDHVVSIVPGECVILSVPPSVAATLVPDLTTPMDSRAIVNAHFKVVPPVGCPPMTGVINGLAEWIFAFPDRLSVTISAADRLSQVPREELARQIWMDVAKVCKINEALPPWQIITEARATFAATPVENSRRPYAKTAWKNLFLAGDWTQTGLPATIEGAIRSGVTAAKLAYAACLSGQAEPRVFETVASTTG